MVSSVAFYHLIGMTAAQILQILGLAAGVALGAWPGAPLQTANPPAPEAGPPPAYPGYALAWADEFDRDGPPDAANWAPERGFVRNRELQWYTPANARVAGGFLVIEARRERVPNPDFDKTSRGAPAARAEGDPSTGSGSSRAKSRDESSSPQRERVGVGPREQLGLDWKHSREFAEYTSASLATRGLRSWQYGRFEMRARIDTRAGLWPAFWTLGVEGSWPHNGEIDIMEYYRGLLLANVAWGGPERFRAIWADTRTPIASFDSAWPGAFHVWRMDWDEQAIALSVDGQVLNKVDLTRTVNQDAAGINPFHQPHYLLVNLSVGGTQGGDPSSTAFPARYEIDYVRVYQRSK